MEDENFNLEPVYYCSRCLSLKIRSFGDNSCYCDECGNTQVETTDIDTWEKMYESKYNVKFLNKK